MLLLSPIPAALLSRPLAPSSSFSLLVRWVVGFEIHPARCPVNAVAKQLESQRSTATPKSKTSRSAASLPAFPLDLTLRHLQPRAIPSLATVDGPLPWEAYCATTALHDFKSQRAQESDRAHQHELQPIRYVKRKIKSCCCVDRVFAAMKQHVRRCAGLRNGSGAHCCFVCIPVTASTQETPSNTLTHRQWLRPSSRRRRPILERRKPIHGSPTRLARARAHTFAPNVSARRQALQ